MMTDMLAGLSNWLEVRHWMGHHECSYLSQDYKAGLYSAEQDDGVESQ